MISSGYLDKYFKIGKILVIVGLCIYLFFPYISSLTFGIGSSIISFCWLSEDIKKYGVFGYKRGIIKRYGLLILTFLMSLKAELVGALLFILGYVIGQWYMIFKVLRNEKVKNNGRDRSTGNSENRNF